MDEDKINEAMEKARKSYGDEPIQEEHEPQVAIVAQTEAKTELVTYEERATKAMELVDDIVLKNYLTKLEQMEIIDAPGAVSLNNEDFILFKINKMVYEKDEYATDKFISVVNAMTYARCAIYLIVDGQVNHTDFYLGVKGEDDDRSASSIAKTFESALKGQFPGLVSTDLSMKTGDAQYSEQEKLMASFKEAKAISLYAGIPANRNSKGEYTNANFIQGIEKFATAMQGHRYTAIILASNTTAQEIVNIRNGYENIYTELSAMATQQLAYSTNESMANAISRTKGVSETHTVSSSYAESDGISQNESVAKGSTSGNSKTEGVSKENFWGTAGKIAAPLFEAGAILTGTGVGIPVGVAMMGLGAIGAVGGIFGEKQKSKSVSTTESESTTYTTSDGVTHTTTKTKSVSDGHTDSFSETDGTTSTIGSSKNFTITAQNKHIQEILKRIDKQLERIEMSESTGLWSVGTYFLSYNNDHALAETAASVFRSIMQGEQSGVEVSAINSWFGNDNPTSLVNYATALTHPVFKYDTIRGNIEVTPTSLLSSKEVAMMIGLPRKSVPGLPVVDHVSLAKEVVKLGVREQGKGLLLGCVFDQGQPLKDNPVNLDVKSLTQHTFVTGSTGCGKSNAIYHLIHRAKEKQPQVKFLIVEPAKGEYKNVFGNFDVYGTNPLISILLKINPFRFPQGVHVLEHIDRLTEIFNVCWPMYAAMPAVLKEAMLNSYEKCGWDLYSSKNAFSEELFPTFADLLDELTFVIGNSAYSEEVKSNYTGSLVTRVKSLAMGINKQIFCGNEIGDKKLFDENVVIDLSRIGSQETKALIMGMLIMRLNEYRANSGIIANSDLKHITILEEAHNILKRTSTEQDMEGANVAGKSVEMISNSIAEMRTFGEGFIVVDQSPGTVDISAIRNTNTKIIMRLPEENDRIVAGKAAAMKDGQIDEIAKLPTGVAVVYQNDWEAPVLCQIAEFAGEKHPYEPKPEMGSDGADSKLFKQKMMQFLLQGRVKDTIEPDILSLKEGLNKTDLPTGLKLQLFKALNEYERKEEILLCRDNHFHELSQLVTEIASLRMKVERAVQTEKNMDALNNRLYDLIQNEIPGLSQNLCEEVRHCLMRDYSMGSDIKRQIYSVWKKQMKIQ